MLQIRKAAGAVFCAGALGALAGYGGIITNNYSWVRGTHYRINGDAAKTARELGYGRRVGLNAVRFWMSLAGKLEKHCK